jgi:hypothetical protein
VGTVNEEVDLVLLAKLHHGLALPLELHWNMSIKYCNSRLRAAHLKRTFSSPYSGSPS